MCSSVYIIYKIQYNFALTTISKINYLAMADPAGSVNGLVALVAGFTITVPSTNGANPGRNL